MEVEPRRLTGYFSLQMVDDRAAAPQRGGRAAAPSPCRWWLTVLLQLLEGCCVIRLQCIYNLWSIHAIILPVLDV